MCVHLRTFEMFLNTFCDDKHVLDSWSLITKQKTKNQQNSNLNFHFVTKEHLFQTCLPSQKWFKNVSNLRNETALYCRTNCNYEKKKKIEGQKHALFV